MNRWGIRRGQATPRRDAELDALVRESERSADEPRPAPAGGSHHVPSMPFTQDKEAFVSGLFGPPAWAVRLKRIHDGRTALTARLEHGWAEYARRLRGQPARFEAAWRTFVDRLDLDPLNTLIRKHNEYYPIEARLPILYPRNEYYVPPGIDWPQRSVTRAAILDQYPADLDMALYFTGQIS
jgi:hypothetical protein